MKQTKKIMWVFLLWFITGAVFADSSPVALLQSLSDQMIAQLKAKKMVLKQNPGAVHGMVRSILLPHVDTNAMSKAVLGPEWDKATPSQRAQFIQRFTTIVIDTYASALASYSNESVQILPLRESSGKTVKVDSRIIRQGAPSIPVSYRLLRSNGGWKIYDLNVDGVSLVQNYRSQFSGILRSKGGMPGLLQAMSKHSSRSQ